jgi:hypothetical protein
MGTSRFAVGLALVALAAPPSAGAATVAPGGHRQAVLRTAPGHTHAGRRPSLAPFPRQPRRLRAAKAAARDRAHRAARGARAASAPAATPPFTGLNEHGLGAGDALLSAPPDTTGSIGPGDYVEEVNDGVAVFRRSDLARVAGPIPNELFMHSPFPTFVSDPQMQWDQRQGRWVYLAVAFTIDFRTLQPSGPNYLLYGFSKSSDPTDLSGGWCHYSLASGSAPDGAPLIDDYPKLGHDDRRLIFGSNVFTTGGSESFVTARIWSVPTPPAGPLSACPTAPVATTFGSAASPLRTPAGALAFTPVPANTFNASTHGYIVAADDATNGAQRHITSWHMSGPASSPTLNADGEIPVASYSVPRPAFDFIFPQIDTLDARLTMAVANADPATGGQEAVWTVHTVDPGNGRVVVRWYELLPRSGRARQIGTVTSPWVDVYNGSISPTADGSSAILDFNRSGLLLLPELDARAHRSSMATGSSSPGVRIGSSGAPDFDLSCAPVCRWGDYSGASPDPTVPSTVWIAGETIDQPGGLFPSWVTRIAQLSPTGTRSASVP